MGGSSTVLSDARPARNDNRIPAYGYRVDGAEHCIAYPFNEDDGRVRQDFVCFSHGDAALIALAPDLAADVLRLSAAVADLTAQLAKSDEMRVHWLDTAEKFIALNQDLTAANTALVTECARLKSREADAREERKFYRADWPINRLLAARNDGLLTDKGEAWRYSYTGMDGEGGKYDLLYRRTSSPARAYLAGGAE